MPPPGVSLRDLGDPIATRDAIHQGALRAAAGIPPAANTRLSLAVENPTLDGPERFTARQHKQAVLRNETLSKPLKADWVLRDHTGKELERKRTTLAHVPYLTDRGTFVINGVEMTMAHQLRLRPGVYGRVKESGETELHANVLPGKGFAHRYTLDPETGVFKVQLDQSEIPAMPLLRAFGATDRELRDAWGDELFSANLAHDEPAALDKLVKKVARQFDPAAPREAKFKTVADTFGRFEFDPEVNRRTLGHPHAKLDKAALLAMTKKLLLLNRGEAEEDDRDHLAYQRVLGPEEAFAERLARSTPLLKNLLWKVTTRGALDRVPANYLGKHVGGALTDSGLGQALEEVNALEILDRRTQVTRMGQGGLSSADSIPAASRDVHGSQVGFLDLTRTPESLRAGVDLRGAMRVKKGSDGRLYAPHTNARTGAEEWVSPQDLQDRALAFPGSFDRGARRVPALVKGRVRYVPPAAVDYVLPTADHWFGHSVGVVPFKQTNKGQRNSMGGRFWVQAVSLTDPEAQLVSPLAPGTDRPVSEVLARDAGAVFAVHAKDQPGTVVAVEPHGIKVRYADGTEHEHELANNHVLNRKSILHNDPVVRAGDAVQPGQLLAKSNYTDKQGRVALGKNLRAAYTSFRGLNWEDGVVVSESAAKKLSHIAAYQHHLEHDENLRPGLKAFVAAFPRKFERPQLANVGDDGVVRPGATVNPGDPLVVAAARRDPTHKSLYSGKKDSWEDRSITWDHHNPGVVTDVEKTDKGTLVVVKSTSPLVEADKLSGLHGDKGTVTGIIADAQMPRDPKTGEPYEILMNPLGLVSRTNAAQKAELWLSKIAAATGKPYHVRDFAHDDVLGFVNQELAKHGLSGEDEVEDPVTGRRVKVATGVRHVLKLHHFSESKAQGRGLGEYSSEGQPSKADPDASSKRFALMHVHAALGHGAYEVLKDAKLVRGQKNQEYWTAFMRGEKPPTPGEPFVFQKTLEQLRGAGIHVHRKGAKTHLMALTDADVDELAQGRELQNANTVRWDGSMAGEPGGLFDPALTGGHGGRKWAAIPLAEPLPNPVFEEPIRRLLGLTQKRFEAVLAGREALGDNGVGPAAVRQALGRVRVDNALERAVHDFRFGRKAARDDAAKRIAVLRGLQKTGRTPADLVLAKVPVLPPAFRPVSLMQTGSKIIADSNYLYKDLFDANEALKGLTGKVADLGDERLNLYRAFKAVSGLGDPVNPKNEERGVRGLLGEVLGDSPKFGSYQRKLLGTPVELVGRGVASVDPDLHMDEAGIPEPQAWDVYAPFVVRNLVRRGFPGADAVAQLAKKTATARAALQAEMGRRPVLVDRAPVLHRYGLMAFWPKLVRGNAIKMPTAVFAPYGMDLDGDQINFHVPGTDAAAAEAAEKMLPSRQLFSQGKFDEPVYQPRQEYLAGLYAATRAGKSARRTQHFARLADVMRAFRNGEIDLNDPVEVLGK